MQQFKNIPLFDGIHTSMIVATHVIDYDSLESQSDVDYVILYLCFIPWSRSHVLYLKFYSGIIFDLRRFYFIKIEDMSERILLHQDRRYERTHFS